MVVNYPTMSSVDFGVPDLCFLICDIDKVKACAPPGAALGLRELTVGIGFMSIAKFEALEVPPPGAGLKTVTVAVPVATMSLAEI